MTIVMVKSDFVLSYFYSVRKKGVYFQTLGTKLGKTLRNTVFHMFGEIFQ